MDAWLEYLFNLGETYRLFFAAAFFLFGLLVGSFLNVAIYRLPENISLAFPRSFCPQCKHGIRWHDNVPLISFLILRGQCRDCHAKISPQYFIVEFFTGLMFLGLFLYAGLTPELFWGFWFFSSLVAVTVIDFKTMTIPDEITLPGILVAWFFALAFPQIFNETSHRMALGESVLGMIAGGGLIWITAFFGDMIFKRESMGGGDIKLLAMIGAFMGIEGAILTFFIAPFFALPYGLIQKWVRKSDVLPYGPFLAMAAVFNVFFADRLLNVIVGVR